MVRFAAHVGAGRLMFTRRCGRKRPVALNYMSRRWSVVRAASSILPFVFLGACSSSTEPEIGDFDVTLSLTPTSLAPGDTARIEIFVTNLSSRPLVFSTGGCPLIEVAEAAQMVGYLGMPPCTAALYRYELSPNERRSVKSMRYTLGSSVWRPSGGASAHTWTDLAPGEYLMTAIEGEFRSGIVTVAIAPASH